MEQFCPTEFIRSTRQEAVAPFEEQELAHFMDGPEGQDHVVRSVHALLATNQEILDRINTECLDTDMEDFSAVPRTGLRRVKVEPCSKGQHRYVAEVETTTKNFGEPPSLPVSLAEVFSILKAPSGSPLPDYSDLFRKIVLLDKSTMLSFMSSLKEHLDLLQSFLGGVEGWLAEPQVYVESVERVFEKERLDLSSTDLEVLVKVSCRNCDEATTLSYMSAQKKKKWECSNCGTTSRSNRSIGQLHGLVLETASIPGEHQAYFDLDSETERKRLEAFVNYAT